MSAGSIKLGPCITLINQLQREYEVTYLDIGSDSHDPLNRIPAAYRFDQLKPKSDPRAPSLIVKLTDELLSFYLQKGTSETHFQAVKYGIRILKDDPLKTEVIFTTDEYERFQKQPQLSGKQLRFEILRFVHSVNEHWPTENISVFDLYENLNATREDIETWGNHLVEAGFLKVGTPKASERAGVSTRSYRVNVAKRKEIDEELRSFVSPDGKLKVFLSYSHKDKQIAADVKREFEEYGFEAFVAHDDIELSREWEGRILEELRTCHVFIPILTENFRESLWTDQEAGHALSGSKVIIPLRVTIDPYGFIARFQGEKLHKELVTDSCRKIVEVLSARSELIGFFTEESRAVQKLKGSIQ